MANKETEGADIAGDVLIGIVACGVLAGDADGEVQDEEVDALVEIVAAFLAGLGWTGSTDDVRAATADVAQRISDLGVAKTLAGLPGLLTDDDQRRIGCMVAVAVVGADGEIERAEARMYVKIASALGYSEDEAQEIWDEVANADEEEEEEAEDED